MAIVIASMVGIVLVAVGVLVLAFIMHVVSRSPRLRRATRRWALGAAAGLYTARRSTARWSRRFAGAAARRCWPVVTSLRSAAERATRPGADESVAGSFADAEPRVEREPVPVEAAVRH